MNKPCGNYITVQTPPLWNSLLDPQQEIDAVADCIRHFLPKNGVVLIVGLGNRSITPDALGPMVAERIIATRHLGASLAEQLGLSSLRKTAAIAPGVMGQTGIETGEIVRSVVSFLKPSAVIAVDALAAQDYKRLGKTIQISDSGISPGSGVQNSTGSSRPLGRCAYRDRRRIACPLAVRKRYRLSGLYQGGQRDGNAARGGPYDRTFCQIYCFCCQ